MATDAGTIIFGVLAVVGPIVTNVLNQRNQAKGEKERQLHELRRDRLATYASFGFEEYRECRDACGKLLAATQHFLTAAGARKAAIDAYGKFPTPKTLGTGSAEFSVFDSAIDRAAQYADEALRVLRVDEDAAAVVEAYQMLPTPALLDAPKDADVKRRWRESVAQLQQEIITYLQAKRAKLLPNG